MKWKGYALFFAISEVSSFNSVLTDKLSAPHYLLAAGVFATFLAFICVLRWLKARWYHFIAIFVFLGLIASTAYFAGEASRAHSSYSVGSRQ